MQVWTRCAATHAHLADRLAGPQPLATNQPYRAAAQTSRLDPAVQVAVDVLVGPRTNHQAHAAAFVIDQILHHPCPPVADGGTQGCRYVQSVVPPGTAPGTWSAAVVTAVAQELAHREHA